LISRKKFAKEGQYKSNSGVVC